MYIFGNWKMYLDEYESEKLADELSSLDMSKTACKVAVFPNALAFSSVREKLKDSAIRLGAQNVAWAPKGAYTGATSALLYKESDAHYALIGHSERRHIFGESNEAVRRKFEACLDVGLHAVLCIGETKEDRDEGKLQYRLKKQLSSAMEGLEINPENCIIAYEPVWAIGTGNPCTPADAQDVCGWIQQEIKQYVSGDVAVLYGGSVSPSNVEQYLNCDDIDGVLVGGASTKIESLSSLIESATKVCHI